MSPDGGKKVAKLLLLLSYCSMYFLPSKFHPHKEMAEVAAGSVKRGGKIISQINTVFNHKSELFGLVKKFWV